MSDDDDDVVTPLTPEQGKLPVKELPGAVAFTSMGLTAAILIGLGLVGGLGADREWHSAPWGLLIGIALGTVAAVVSVVQQVRRFL